MISSKDIWFEAWEDYYAKSDSIRERYHREMEDIRNYDLIEQEHHEYMHKVWLAGYGDDQDEYESYWTRALAYYQSQPDDTSE